MDTLIALDGGPPEKVDNLMERVEPGDIEAVDKTIALLDRMQIEMLVHRGTCSSRCDIYHPDNFDALRRSDETLRAIRDSHDRFQSGVAPEMTVGSGTDIERPVVVGTRREGATIGGR